MNPKYLFCDEPNSGLDPKTAILIDNLIQEITAEYNITTVINTHDMNSVMEIGEKIIFLKDGLKSWEGTKEEIFNTENEAVTNFAGLPAKQEPSQGSSLIYRVRSSSLGYKAWEARLCAGLGRGARGSRGGIGECFDQFAVYRFSGGKG